MQPTDSDACLFDDEQIRVTPTWLTLEDTSYAIHNVVRVRLVDGALPRGSWVTLFYVSLVLIVLAAFGARQDHMPAWLGLVLLAASLMLGLTAAWFAFVSRDVYRLEIMLSDNTTLRIQRPGQRYMMQLERALRQSLVLHRGLFREPLATHSQAKAPLGSDVAVDEPDERLRRPGSRGTATPAKQAAASGLTQEQKRRRDAVLRRWLAASGAGKISGVQD